MKSLHSHFHFLSGCSLEVFCSACTLYRYKRNVLYTWQLISCCFGVVMNFLELFWMLKKNNKYQSNWSKTKEIKHHLTSSAVECHNRSKDCDGQQACRSRLWHHWKGRKSFPEQTKNKEKYGLLGILAIWGATSLQLKICCTLDFIGRVSANWGNVWVSVLYTVDFWCSRALWER
jgi:hypothetical protein